MHDGGSETSMITLQMRFLSLQGIFFGLYEILTRAELGPLGVISESVDFIVILSVVARKAITDIWLLSLRYGYGAY